LPFTGKSSDASAYEAVFGYIFGYTTSRGSYNYGNSNTFINTAYGSSSSGVWQYYCKISSYYTSFYYYIPSTLRTLVVTNQTSVPVAAFNGCTMLNSITYSRGISSRGDYAFQNCPATVR